MANIKSAKKRILQSNKRKIQNRSVRTETRTEIKKFLHLVQSGDKETQLTQLRKAEQTLDKAANKGVIHKNKAARLKSKMNKRFNELNTTKEVAKKNISSASAENADSNIEATENTETHVDA